MARWPIAGLIVALLAASPIPARAQQGDLKTPEIVVSGSGEVRERPDLAALQIAIETHAGTAMAAAQSNAKLAARVMDAVNKKLGGHGTVRTGMYQLFAEYSRPGEEGSKVVGYRAVNSLTVRTTALDLAGPLIDAALGAGANRVDSLGFELRDDAAARRDAIGRAVDAARNQAQALAGALGVKLGRVLRASTTMEPRPMPMMRFALAEASPVQTPISPGEVTVSAQVELIYAIGG